MVGWLGGRDEGRKRIGLGGLGLRLGFPVRPLGVDPSDEGGVAWEVEGWGSGVRGLSGARDVSRVWRPLPLPDFFLCLLS